MVQNYKFIKKNITFDKLSILQYQKDTKKFFKSMSSSYSDFLHFYFNVSEGGRLDGFRFIGRVS